MKAILFFLAVAALILIAGVLAVSAAEPPRTIADTQAACLAEYFRFCAGVQINEQDVRACIASHKSSFSPNCLALAKGTK